MRFRHWLALGIVVFAAFVLLSWLTRRPLTEAAIRTYLADKGVEAAYAVAEADSRHLVFENVALGPAGHRDLTARRISVDLAWQGFGPRITAVRVEDPVLRARVSDGGISFGKLDRLIPATKTVRLPAIEAIITNGKVALATPLGPLEAGVDATGRFDKDFRAVIRTAPAALRSANCSGTAGAARFVVTTAARDFAVAGAGSAEKLVCAEAQVPNLHWSFRLAAPITLASLSGDALVQAAAGTAGPLRFSGPSSVRLAGAGTPAQFHGDWRASLARVATATETADSVGGAGSFDWRQVGGTNIEGAVRATNLASGTVQKALAVAGLPDLAARLARRFAAAARTVAVDTQFRAVLGQTAKVTITSADVRGAGGSVLHFVGTPGAHWTAGAIAIDGAATLTGGGLPVTVVKLSALSQGASGWSGGVDLQVQPWREGGGAIAVPGIKISLVNGFANLAGRAIVSTNIGSAQINGLDLRMAARTSLDGNRMFFGPGCADIAVKSVRTESLTLGPFATRLCAANGTAAPAIASGAVSGNLVVSAVALQGQASGRSFAIATQPAQIALAGTTNRPIVRTPGAVVRWRTGDMAGSANLAGIVTAASAGWAGSGRLSAVSADLPAIRIRSGTAQWRLDATTLSLAGVSAQLTDPDAKPRFSPLLLADGGARLEPGGIDGQAAIRLVEGNAPIASVRASYRTETATGSAQIDSTLVFSKQLQPLQISELARGYVANVDGRVISHADLAYDSGGVHGTGMVRFEALSLATAALGPVTGIDGTLHFDDLPRLHTPPSQVINVASINPGVLVESGVATFQIIDAGAISIESMRWPFTGGTLTLQPVVFRAGEAQRRYVLAVHGLDAGLFLQRFDLKNLNASGTFDGVLPLVFAGSTGRIEGGRLTARAGGGMIQYVGDVGQESMGAASQLAFDALRSMRYRSLTLALDGDLDGELVTAVNFVGTNEAPVKLGGGLPLRSDNLPFKFGITVRAPFRALLGTVASFSDARSLLQKAQADADAAAAAPPPKP